MGILASQKLKDGKVVRLVKRKIRIYVEVLEVKSKKQQTVIYSNLHASALDGRAEYRNIIVKGVWKG